MVERRQVDQDKADQGARQADQGARHADQGQDTQIRGQDTQIREQLRTCRLQGNCGTVYNYVFIRETSH